MDLESRRERVAGRLAALAPLLRAEVPGGDPRREMLHELAAALERAPVRLAEPLRLAVAGAIKRGKSTLVNALLERDQQVAFVDELEATFRVNEFRYGPRERVVAYFVDAAGVETRREVPFAELAGLTARDRGREHELRQLRRVVVELPVDLLRTVHLVDTPGLFSVYGTDSTAALRELGGVDRAEIDRADAVLYLLGTETLDGDSRALQDFLGGDTRAGAARAVGVLSRCDEDWAVESGDPLAAAARRAQRQLADPQLRELVYAFVPVSGLVAEGAHLLGSDAFKWLAQLADAEPDELAKALRIERRFLSGGRDPFTLTTEARATLLARLGSWGILRAAHHLRNGLTEEQTREQLVRDSGVAELRELVLSHVGASAYLLKLDQLLDVVRRRLDIARATPGGAADPRVRAVRDAIEEITDEETGFAALRVRRLLRGRHRHGFEAEARERVLRITEPGAGAAERLGAERGADAASLVPLARDDVEFWRSRTGMPSYSNEMRAAVPLLEGIAQDLLDRVERAAGLLREAEELLR